MQDSLAATNGPRCGLMMALLLSDDLADHLFELLLISRRELAERLDDERLVESGGSQLDRAGLYLRTFRSAESHG